MKTNTIKIKKYLKTTQTTREKLAAELDVSMGTVNNILIGKVPLTPTLVKLAKLMNVSPQELLR